MRWRLAFALVVFVAVGCAEWRATEPIPVDQLPKPTTPPPSKPAPPIVAIFDGISPSYVVGTSRYVLYKDSTFGLEYHDTGFGSFTFPGRFIRRDSTFLFDFEAVSASPWGATAVLRGTVLVVRYNEIMQLTDFEDGEYVLGSGGVGP